MVDEANSNEQGLEGVELLRKTSFVIFNQPIEIPKDINVGVIVPEEPAIGMPELGIIAPDELVKIERPIVVQNAFGSVQQYFHGKLNRLREKAETHFSQEEDWEAEIAAAKDIIKVEATKVYSDGYGNIHTTPAYDAAALRLKDAQDAIEELEQPVALPSKEVLDGMMGYTRNADILLQNMKEYQYNLENWDELPAATQDYFFKMLSEEHRNEYQQRLVAEYKETDSAGPISCISGEEETKKLNNLSDLYSVEDFYGANPDRETGLDSITALPRAYKPFESKDSIEFRTFLDTKAFFIGKDIERSTFLQQEIVDRMMGEYPQVVMTTGQIQSELNEMYAGFAKRTGINLVAGVAGVGLTGPAIKALGVASKAAVPVAETYLASQTGVMASEFLIARALISQGFKEAGRLVPQGLVNFGTKAGGLTVGLAGGVLAEAPIDMGLSYMFEGNDLSLENHGLQLPEVSKAEIDEMLKKAIYKDVNPLTSLGLWSGYDAAFMHTPEFYLANKTIPSLGIDIEVYEAGLKGENTDVAERIAHANKLCADLDWHANLNEEIRYFYFTQEKEAKSQEKDAPSEQVVAVSPTEIEPAAANQGKGLAGNNINGRN